MDDPKISEAFTDELVFERSIFERIAERDARILALKTELADLKAKVEVHKSRKRLERASRFGIN